jgi:hypothetical protein
MGEIVRVGRGGISRGGGWLLEERGAHLVMAEAAEEGGWQGDN